MEIVHFEMQLCDPNVCCNCQKSLFSEEMNNKMETSAPGVSANGAVAAPSTPPSSTTSPPQIPEKPNEEQQSSLTDVTDMWIKFAKTFAIIFPIYILGYLEFSFSWVLIGLAVLFYWRKNHINKDYRVNRMLAFLEHEEKAVKQSVSPTELPPWVGPPALLHSWYYDCFIITALYFDCVSSLTHFIGCPPSWV